MRSTMASFFHGVSADGRHISQETLRALLRERLQTSFDGVIRTGECSRSVAGPSPISRSRAGALAILCWIAAISCTSQPATKPVSVPLPRSASMSPSTLVSSNRVPISTNSARKVNHQLPRRGSLRRIHTTTRPRNVPPTVASTVQATTSKALLSNTRNPSHSHSLQLSSLAHPQPRPNSWLDRLASSLSSILGGPEQDPERQSDRHLGDLQARQKSRGTGRIHQFIQDPRNFENIVAPRHPIVLCHGLYGFDVRGPFLGLEIHYWAQAIDILRKKIGAEVLIHGVPATGSIQDRAESLHKFLLSEEAGVRGQKLNFIGHSMGGLDVRYLLTHLRPKPEEYTPISLTTISTPHRGSPFMDWCNANIGIGNDYIEKAIAEARAERASLADRDPRAARAPKVPYTLKAPLFTRPKPLDGSQASAKKPTAQPQQSNSSSLLDAASVAISQFTGDEARTEQQKQKETDLADQVKEAFKQGSQGGNGTGKGNGALPFGLGSFLNSLTSLSGAFSSYMLSLLDTPAYAMLSTKYMNEVFNPKTPNVDGVKYYSVASRTPSLGIWHPLWLPKLILDAAAESRTTGGEIDGSADALGSADQGNDGLVSVESAKWGEFLGVMEGCDHWDLRGGGAPRWKQNINPSTGKPYPPSKQQSSAGKDSAEDKNKSTWIDINRLLFSRSKAKTNDPAQFLKTYNELAESEGWAGVSIRDPEQTEEWLSNEGESKAADPDEDDSEVVVSSFDPQLHKDDTLAQEIATWISDRLPSGDAERRAMAAKRDRIIQETGLTLHSTSSSSSSGSSSGSSTPLGEGQASQPTSPLQGAAATASASMGAAMSSSSQSASFSTDQKTEQAAPLKNANGNSNGKKKDFSDLEKFWIGLCRFLHTEGH